MSLEIQSSSKGMLWTGHAISIVVSLLLLLDAAMKVLKVRAALEGTVQAGYPEIVVAPIGIILLVSTLLYLVPRTSVLGAILLTAYLGGAVATNVRLLNPLFSYILAPVYVGILVWAGLVVRDERVRALIPFRKT